MPPRRSIPATPAAPRLRATVRLSAAGLAKVLGDLEARIMRIIWDRDQPMSARQVHTEVTRSHTVAPITVTTVLNKLVGKRLLRRDKRDDLLHYQACWGEEEFIAHASRQVIEGVLDFEPDAMAASLVDVLAERDPARLAELGRLVRRRLRDQRGERGERGERGGRGGRGGGA